jgi:hypothetical protein
VIVGRARTVAIVGFISSFICVVVLHVVRTDLPPASHRLSEYASGSFGWLMTGAFVSLGCGLVAIAITFAAGGRRLEFAVAFLAAAATFASGVFETGASDADELIHSRASAAAVVAIVCLALIDTRWMTRSRLPSRGSRMTSGLALVALGLAAISPLLHHTRWTGLSQRLLWVALLCWLIGVSCHSGERRGRLPVPAGDRPARRGP